MTTHDSKTLIGFLLDVKISMSNTADCLSKSSSSENIIDNFVLPKLFDQSHASFRPARNSLYF